ncbi:MAG: LPS assembly lipoprotein LptE [Deltaproteobacteria bacterium]|nr:LPS assembly lipoprotein LptE [Deltaproteobacteria bacterium]
MSSLKFALICIILPALAGCGYRAVGLETPVSGERPAIAIPPFGNRSTEVGLETVFANAFLKTFSESGALRVTPRPEEADLVLDGKVASLEYSSVAFFDIDRSVVRKVTIRVEFSLKNRKTGKIVWKDREVFTEDYVVSNNYHLGEATRMMGIRRGAATLSQRVLDKILLVL